jgi:PPOX class probable F420-dependent enzyme
MPAVPLPESTHRLFDTDKHVVLVTVDADSSPQASLVWAERDGDQLLIGMEGYQRKTGNLRRDPRVTLVVQDDRPSQRGLAQYLVIRGTVELEGPDIPADYTELMDKQSHRYLGKDYPFENRHSRTAVIARVTPEKITGEGPWAARG